MDNIAGCEMDLAKSINPKGVVLKGIQYNKYTSTL